MGEVAHVENCHYFLDVEHGRFVEKLTILA